MKLYLVQHGEALAEAVDPDRPLSERGRADVTALAACLARAGVAPARIYHSGKTRARQSAGILAAALGRGDRVSETAGVAPRDPPRPFVDGLAAANADLMLVGHEPFLGRVAALLLTGSDERVPVALVPGGALALVRGVEDRWFLEWMLRPEVLGARE